MKNKQFDMIRYTEYQDNNLKADYVRIRYDYTSINIPIKDIPQFIKELSEKLD